ncbi:MAG: PCP reductase family protein [Nitrospinae bacterium]|nr:PCP reductase family protein [Nitrospinota bacterium]
MKFLCVSCDEGMRLEGARGPHEGSLEATFGCPRCGHKVVLLTNPWETQLVKVLGVKIGGRVAPANPYEEVLSSLAPPREETAAETGADSSGSACPFAGMFGQEAPQVPEDGIRWTDEARLRIERIPSFIRPMVQKAIERYAKEQGHRAITDAVMDEARSRLGM